MSDPSVRLKELKVDLDSLLLDPNNPRFAKSLNLPKEVSDDEVEGRQADLRRLFVTTQGPQSAPQDDDSEPDEGAIYIDDLISSMREIGFIPIDRIVVRELESKSPAKQSYVVIEGNRRVSAAKFLYEHKETDSEKKKKHNAIVKTLKSLDVLLLVTDDLSAADIHHQTGVILGLRHFGSVLAWGTLAKAVNIYNEYRNIEPAQGSFKLDANRVSQVAIRLSESRSWRQERPKDLHCIP